MVVVLYLLLLKRKADVCFLLGLIRYGQTKERKSPHVLNVLPFVLSK